MRSVKVAGLVAVLLWVTALRSAPDSGSAKMRAVALYAYGGPEVMKLENVARPEPAQDDVLIRVIAASINPVDVAIRKVTGRNWLAIFRSFWEWTPPVSSKKSGTR